MRHTMLMSPFVLDFLFKKNHFFIFLVFVLDFKKVHFVKKIIFCFKIKSYYK